MPDNIFIFVLGSVIGSFLNVCIYRMPREESIVSPGSHCPQCNKPIAWYDNIPLISFILLGGKCRSCGKPVSPRYFIVELLTALGFLALYLNFGATFEFVFYSIFVSGLIVATFVDISHRIIPDEISVGGIVVGLLLSIARGIKMSPSGYDFSFPLDSLLGILAGGGIIYFTGAAFDFVYFKLLKRPAIQGETESMGGGDVKLLAMIGAFLGWKSAVLTFFLAPFFGVIVGLANLVFKKDHTIPYGPFLSLAAVINLFWSGQLLAFFFLRHA